MFADSKYRLLIIAVSAIMLFFVLDAVINSLMMHGVKNYYGLNGKPQILLVGHSHLMLATDKARMERELGMPISKYCREGVSVTDKKTMVEHFFNSVNTDSMKYVLYGVDLATFTGSGLSQNSYQLFYPFIDDPNIAKYVKSQASNEDYWLHKLIRTSRLNDDGLKNSAVRGWLNNWDNLKNKTIDIEAYKKWQAGGKERSIGMNENLMSQFRETVEFITSRGKTVILVNTPTLDLLNQYEPEKYERIMNWFREFADSNPKVLFWDFNPQYESDHTIFADRLHLNKKGQEVITTELIKKITQLDYENPD